MFILVSSRNNYQLFENFFLKHNSLPFEKIINVDTGSNETQKSLGRNICNSNKINFVKIGAKNNRFQQISAKFAKSR